MKSYLITLLIAGSLVQWLTPPLTGGVTSAVCFAIGLNPEAEIVDAMPVL